MHISEFNCTSDYTPTYKEEVDFKAEITLARLRHNAWKTYLMVAGIWSTVILLLVIIYLLATR